MQLTQDAILKNAILSLFLSLTQTQSQNTANSAGYQTLVKYSSYYAQTTLVTLIKIMKCHDNTLLLAVG